MAPSYPYGSWQEARPDEVGAVANLSAVSSQDRWQLAGTAAARLLGVAPRLRAGRPQASYRDAGPQIAIRLSYGSDGQPWFVSMPFPLAADLADRTLGGDGTEARDAAVASTGLDPMGRGAIAYLCARVLANLGSELAFDSFVDGATVHARLGRGGWVAVPVSVDIEGRVAQCWVACAVASLPRPRPQLGAAAARLELSVVALGATATLPMAQLQRVRVGDAITLDRSWVRPEASGIVGSVQLRALGSRRTLATAAILGEGFEIQCVDSTEEQSMHELRGELSTPQGQVSEDSQDTSIASKLVELAGDAPVELQVELARFSLTLTQLLELGPGQLLSTARPVGEQVNLLAAGQVIAQGELVNIDGIVGVRVHSLSGTTKTGPEASITR